MEREFLLALVAAIIIAFLSPFARTMWQMVSGLLPSLFGYVPYVKGHWETEYTEPGQGGARIPRAEMVTLNQIGRFLWGKSRVKGSTDRAFSLRAYLVGHTVLGRHRRVGRRKSVGTGAFQLRVAANEKGMTGYCMWHDDITNSIEISEYTWKQQ